MFDFAWSEFALIGVVALLFIGPKDMPAAIRTISNVVKKGRKLAGEFQTHVDEMVRDADLGEARDQLRQLKSFNVRGQLMRALDEDGSMRRLGQQKPRDLLAATPPAGGAPVDAVPATAVPADGVVQPVLVKPLDERPRFAAPKPLERSWAAAAAPDPVQEAEQAAALEAADPGPRILPPATARRLRLERAQPRPPAFLPPRPLHVDPAIIPPRRR